MTGQVQDSSPANTPVRRFAIEPVETTSKSNQTPKPILEAKKPEQTQPKRKFVPQLEETTTKSTGRRKGGRRGQSTKATSDQGYLAPSDSRTDASSSKRFTPQLVESARRSRKNGDQGSALQHTDRTDISPGDKIHLPRHIRLGHPMVSVKQPEYAAFQKSDVLPQVPESRFSYASLSKKTPRRSSFRVPQLDPIVSPGDSDDSNESNVPSLSTTPSAISDENEIQKSAHRIKVSGDEKFSAYILSLAARAAEKQLQEQALAAFPNERFHQPVDHFAGNRDSTDSDEEGFGVFPGGFDDPDVINRRMSSTGWDLLEMQKHNENLEEQRRQQQLADRKSRNQGEKVDPWHNPFDLKALQGSLGAHEPKNPIGGALRDSGELAKWRNAASPPMLGKDLTFPWSISPKQTMIDPTQKPRSRLKRRHDGIESRKQSGLWTPSCNSPGPTRKNTGLVGSGAPSPCLWGGFCNEAQDGDFLCVSNTQLQPGLMTPKIDQEKEPLTSHQLPASTLYADTASNLDNIDAVLNFEVTIEIEYPDQFVTQVYNYLSLGYPALAHSFDAELSKISRISVEEIRRGDERADTKGHVGAPDGGGWDEKRCKEECGRWAALKLYIHEWARQQPHMIDGGKQAWGTRARKGSWAI